MALYKKGELYYNLLVILPMEEKMAITKSANSEKTRRLVGIALLSAIIIVLQVICTFIKFGPFTITLALTPIIIGAAIYGPLSGAFLGAVLGLVIFFAGLFGWDPATLGLIQMSSLSPLFVFIICVVKTSVAGFVCGVVYKAISKKNEIAASIVSSILCPVINTAIFLVGMFSFFFSSLESWAGEQNVLLYAITGLVGINFLVEFATVLILSVTVSRIIKIVKKNKA